MDKSYKDTSFLILHKWAYIWCTNGNDLKKWWHLFKTHYVMIKKNYLSRCDICNTKFYIPTIIYDLLQRTLTTCCFSSLTPICEVVFRSLHSKVGKSLQLRPKLSPKPLHTLKFHTWNFLINLQNFISNEIWSKNSWTFNFQWAKG